ncbi:MAG: chemotaxis response regulator protein-glutamate methylesterase [Pseudomonadota bacterium]
MERRALRRIRVLIVDDSALVRQMLREILDSDPEIEVVGYAANAAAAREKIRKLEPDVMTLDVEMPGMDGISFLRQVMRLRPLPVVMVSSLTAEGAEVTLEALSLGAVDFVCKPRVDISGTLGEYASEIIDKVRAAASARPLAADDAPVEPVRQSGDFEVPTDVRLIALGASAGGVEAIRELVDQLEPDLPGMVITQHIPGGFSAAFARRIDQRTPLTVKEAEDGDRINENHVFIAPGGRHLRVVREGAQLVCRIDDGPRVSQHRPSVDVLFRSVAEAVGAEAVGVLLTGMGSDGAHGLAELHRRGALTVAQDEASSVIWGMPREAVLLGCVDHVLPLGRIPTLLRATRESVRSS